MPDGSSLLAALGVMLGMAAITWIVSLAKRDVSIVDTLWSLMFLAAAWVYWLTAASASDRGLLVVMLVAAWSIRLAVHITWRNWGEGEDRRYVAIRARNEPGFAFKSLYLVFALQALVAWVVSLPLYAAMQGAATLGAWDYAGLALFGVGLLFEAVGDWQLAAFKRDPANSGNVLDHGLWRYTRHPNYFGNACIWWGLFFIAVGAGGWWSVISPLLMTFLLLRVSGVALLEKDIAERRPAYRDYIRRTNAFLPGPPKRVTAASGGDV